MIRDRAWLQAYVATHRVNARVTAAGEAFETAGREETQRKTRPLAVKVSTNITPAPRVAFKATTHPRESELQRACVAYLRARGIIVWEMFKGSARGGSVWATKGIPDLYLPAWGWIELKTSSGAVSVEQYKRHEELRAAGQRIAVITTLNELIEVIQ